MMTNELSRAEIDADTTWAPVGFKARTAEQVAESCDRCGMIIAHPYGMQNSAGRYITVGCDCAAKILNTLDRRLAGNSLEVAKLARDMRTAKIRK